jgi:hypothetical protein
MEELSVRDEEDFVGLSRKREKELDRLKGTAAHVWDEQKDVIDHASRVVREASRQAALLGREEVAPRVRDAVDNHIRPSLASARSAAGSTREKFVEEVLPGVASALSSAIAVLDAARDPRVREALGRVGKAGSKLGSKVGAKVAVTPAKSSGPGRYILIGVGVVAAVGLAYAAWQTLRADDELWVTDETEEELPGAEALETN